MRLTVLLAGAAIAPLALATAASAQEAPIATAATATVEELIVNSELAFRDRTNDINPVLSYDVEYFQRFEPVSVGEMLKRVPGVTFTSDVLEFDGVSMRGLPPGYTQVLINGRRAPGGEADRSFFVDRIPAELVERIEIIRSPRADQPSDGMAGSLNIVLKEGAMLSGGFAKLGALINEDGEVRPSAALAYAGGDDALSWWGAVNYQGRRNPKKKTSWRYEDDFGDLDNIEYQDDTRDGVDISANGELTWRPAFGRIRLNGLVVDTDRDEDETSMEYAADGAFDGAEIQAERIAQRTYALAADAKFDLGLGELDLELGWNAYDEDTTTHVHVTDEEDLSAQELDEYVELNIEDVEWDLGAAYSFDVGAFKLKGGVDYLIKTRDGSEVEFDIDDGVIGDPDPEPGAIYRIEETRIDPYLRATFEPLEMVTLDLGLRYEMTDRDVTSDMGEANYEVDELNPSAHLTVRPTADDKFYASVARTVRRPNYDWIVPYTAAEEPTDRDALQGNPLLKNETAWGVDAGYERRIGQRGIFGVNVFFRNVEDLIAIADAGRDVNEDGETPDGTEDPEDLLNLRTPVNIGSGETWGVEFDFASPLTLVGLPDTGVFLNYTWMDSSVRDPLTGETIPFTNQPSHVYNVGFVHNVRAYDVSFGASLYDRDMGYEYTLEDAVTVDYDADLEAFVEKRFGDRIVVRLAGMNLLDKEKKETFRTYQDDVNDDGDSSVAELLEARRLGVIAESEREAERSGALYQVTVRMAF